MRLRNNIFAAAFDYLKREKGIKTQKRLAELMGVSEDTITRILKDRCEVTEDIITKLQTASGCIFNLQWLRGEDSTCMLAKDMLSVPELQPIDQSSLVNAALAAKDDAIESLKRELNTKDELIKSLRDQLATKDQLIAEQKARLIDYRRLIDSRELENNYPFPIGVADEKHAKKRA